MMSTEVFIYKKYKNVVCLGIGGGLVYHVALFFHLLGSKVSGFDQSENQRTEELISRGIAVIKTNPSDSVDYKVDLIIYSSAMPKELVEKLKSSNSHTEFAEVGEFTLSLIDSYDQRKLTAKEKKAFLDSDIAPLYKLDLGDIPVAGVTGTDGKTTTCEMIYHLLNKLGQKPAVITTVSAKFGGIQLDTGFHTTTPTAQELYKLLTKFKNLGCTHIILEVTSHALAMGRVAGLKVDVAVVTNVTQEHLDYHKTWDNYLEAKSFIVTKNLKPKGTLVISKTDQKVWEYLAYKIVPGQSGLSIPPLGIKSYGDKITFTAQAIKVTLNMFGEYNAYNACNALGACLSLGFKGIFSEMCRHLASFKGVEGRMQVIQNKPFMVIVDFAHTPNALENALKATRGLVGRNSKVIVVFGCAGNRDALKRPLMGAVAKKYADITILTAEDPRTEKVVDINSQIKKGWDKTDGVGKKLLSITSDDLENRKQAIRKALNLAKSGDVVIICGKGHEKSLCFGITECSWSDIDETKQALKG